MACTSRGSMRLERAAITVILGVSALGGLGVVSGTAAAALNGCGSSLPMAPSIAQPENAFIDVPFPPPPPRVEFVPPKPKSSATWVDGAWTREGTRWRWKRGGWFDVPPGVFYSQWETKRPDGTRLLFAAPAWRDAKGNVVPDPPLLERAKTNFNAEALHDRLEDGGNLPDAGPEASAAVVTGLIAEAGALDVSREDGGETEDGGDASAMAPSVSVRGEKPSNAASGVDGGATK
jgi:hypothetical protein